MAVSLAAIISVLLVFQIQAITDSGNSNDRQKRIAAIFEQR
jgi:hypothetical protein